MVSKVAFARRLVLAPAGRRRCTSDLIQLREDVLASGASAELLLVGADGVQQQLLLLHRPDLQRLLDDVVGVLVVEQVAQLAGVGDLHDDLPAHARRRAAQDLLDHVGAVLLARQLRHAAQHAARDALRLLRLSVLDQVLRLTRRRDAHLDHVVAEGVADELVRVLHDGVQQQVVVLGGRGVQAALHHAAAVAVRGDLRVTYGESKHINAAVDHLLEDVDAVLLGHVLQAALDDVVAVGVRAEVGDVPAQRVHDGLHHVRLLAHLDQALYAARAVHVVGGVHDLVLHLVQLR